jgi:anti-anti-sigma factor
VHLQLSGDLDIDNVTGIVDQVEAAAHNGEHELVLDFELVTFCGAAALSIIVRARRHHMHVTIRRPSRAVLRVLEISELIGEVTVEN